MIQAVCRSDPSMVQWLLDHFPGCPIYQDVLTEVCKGGHIWVLNLLEKNKRHGSLRWGGLVMDDAADNGHWDVIRWVYDRNLHTPISRRGSAYLANCAFKQNNLEQIKWLAARGCKIFKASSPKYSEETWEASKEMMRYLLDGEYAMITFYEIDCALYAAAQAGDLEFFQWLIAHGRLDLPDSFRIFLRIASEYGHIAMVQWLISQMKNNDGFNRGPSAALYCAAKGGKLELVHYLFNQYGLDPLDPYLNPDGASASEYGRISADSTEMDVAATHGHLDVLQFLHQVDQSLQKEHEERSIKYHHARHRDYQLCTTMAMDRAAECGHLDVVKWLHANRTEGCTTAAMDRAAANGHLRVVQWLHMNRSEGCTTAAMDNVATATFHEPRCFHSGMFCCEDKKPESFVEDQLTLLKWLHSNRSEGCTTKAIGGAAENGNVKVVRWLLMNTTARCTTDAMYSAARYGRLDIVKLPHSNRPTGCSSNAMDRAAANGHFELVKWLYENCAESCPATALERAAGFGSWLPRRQQFRIVQWFLSFETELSITSAMTKALRRRHFEILLLLHAQYRNVNADELWTPDIYRLAAEWHESGHEILAWVKENIPLPA